MLLLGRVAAVNISAAKFCILKICGSTVELETVPVASVVAAAAAEVPVVAAGAGCVVVTIGGELAVLLELTKLAIGAE